MHPKQLERELGEIHYSLTPWESKLTAGYYALKYRRLKSMQEADEYMKQIKDRIINYAPFADMKW